MIDASHDNSGKDPARQVVAAGEIADQIADGNGAIVGVMLESFLVEGRQDLDRRWTAHLRPVDHRRLHRLGGRPSRCSSSLGRGGAGRGAADEDRRPRRRPDRRLDRARRAASGSAPRWSGFDPDPATLERGGRARRDRPRRRARVDGGLRGRRGRLLRRARSAALPELGRGRARRPAAPTPSSPTSARPSATSSPRSASDERFIGGHPLAGAETAGVENARADLFEGARWYLTPDRALQRRSSTTACSGPSPASARAPQAIDAEAHDRLMATVSHLPHVVANVLVAQAAAELTRDSERMPEVGPSFRDTTRVAGSNPAIWGDIFASNREAVADGGRRRRASGSARRRS